MAGTQYHGSVGFACVNPFVTHWISSIFFLNRSNFPHIQCLSYVISVYHILKMLFQNVLPWILICFCIVYFVHRTINLFWIWIWIWAEYVRDWLKGLNAIQFYNHKLSPLTKHRNQRSVLPISLEVMGVICYFVLQILYGARPSTGMVLTTKLYIIKQYHEGLLSGIYVHLSALRSAHHNCYHFPGCPCIDF